MQILYANMQILHINFNISAIRDKPSYLRELIPRPSDWLKLNWFYNKINHILLTQENVSNNSVVFGREKYYNYI